MIELTIILYILASVIIVSLISLIGIFAFLVKSKNFDSIVMYLVSMSVGALFGDVFIHLLPDVTRSSTGPLVGIYVLVGIVFSFIVEKFIHWRHCHMAPGKGHVHSFTYVNIIGDSVHNSIDGIVIAGSYFVSIPVGIATTIAVIFHEIPHEFGNFGILVHGGFTKLKALFFNFITALAAIFGAVLGIVLENSAGLSTFLVPFAAGNLIYIAGTDLIPELHKKTIACDADVKESIIQLVAILIGVGFMMALLLFE